MRTPVGASVRPVGPVRAPAEVASKTSLDVGEPRHREQSVDAAGGWGPQTRGPGQPVGVPGSMPTMAATRRGPSLRRILIIRSVPIDVAGPSMATG